MKTVTPQFLVSVIHFSSQFAADPLTTRYKQVGQELKVISDTAHNDSTRYVDHEQLRLEIKSIFSGRIVSQAKFDRFMRERLSDSNSQIIADFMRMSGKKTGNASVTKKHLLNISRQIEKTSASTRWDYRNVSFVMYGIQSFDESNAGYMSILTTMAKITNLLNKNPSPLPDSQNISMFISGLQNNRGTEENTNAAIQVLTTMVDRCKDTFTTQSISTCFYALQELKSSNPYVRTLLTALVQQVKKCRVPLDSQAVSSAMYGLQGMSSEHIEVREVLTALLPKIIQCTQSLNTQGIGNSLYGLKNMSSDHAEVLLILSALAKKIKQSTSALDSQGLCNAMYGLRGMSSSCVEVREVVSAIANKLITYKMTIGAQGTGNALYGMQGMSSDSIEVRTLLGILAEKITVGDFILKSQEVSNALYGLQGMSDEVEEVKEVLIALIPKIEGCVEDFNQRALSASLCGLSAMNTENDEVNTILLIIAKNVQKSEQIYDCQTLCDSIQRLGRMSAGSAVSTGVRAMMSALTEKIDTSNVLFDTHNIGCALRGLRSMDAKCSEAILLMEALTKIILKGVKHDPKSTYLQDSIQYLKLGGKDSTALRNLGSAMHKMGIEKK